MGHWGVGISQSDAYCETYEKFIEEYDKGKPVCCITKDILSEWLEEFEEEDGILHDVYFALGKAEWMCGGVSTIVMNRIEDIITSESDIMYWKELFATPLELRQRQKALNSFLKSISNPRGTVRKRKISEEKYVAEPKHSYLPMPKVTVGDVFACKKDGLYRIFGIVRHQKVYGRTVVFCYLWKEKFLILPNVEELFNAHIMPLGYLNSDVFPKESNRIYIGNIPSLKRLGVVRSPDTICNEWKLPVFSLAMKNMSLKEYSLEQCMTLEEVLNKV